MAAGFEVIKDLRDAELVELPVSSFSGTKGDLVERVTNVAYWTACTATSPSWTPKAILMETVTSASTVLGYRLTGNETVRAESTNNANASHNGQHMVLTDTNTVNNTGTNSTTDYVAFVQEGYSGATTDKRLIGRIIVGNGWDPSI